MVQNLLEEGGPPVDPQQIVWTSIPAGDDGTWDLCKVYIISFTF